MEITGRKVVSIQRIACLLACLKCDGMRWSCFCFAVASVAACSWTVWTELNLNWCSVAVCKNQTVRSVSLFGPSKLWADQMNEEQVVDWLISRNSKEEWCRLRYLNWWCWCVGGMNLKIKPSETLIAVKETSWVSTLRSQYWYVEISKVRNVIQNKHLSSNEGRQLQ